jgi:hypothetical protein
MVEDLSADGRQRGRVRLFPVKETCGVVGCGYFTFGKYAGIPSGTPVSQKWPSNLRESRGMV